MQFKDYLATFPDISHLSGLDVLNASSEAVHHIPAQEGKLGSLKLYNALAEKFGGTLDKTAASQGIAWFAEHLEDAKQNIGKHPNIDLLLKVIEQDLTLQLQPNAK
ncbi:RNA polymerase subunit sigma-32 [[Actinobacillus] muris]|uniref:RNA polymerase subunit sigma-32 n=1 Tax=Muribacter muris TaxID=67855 RepID=A0A0J5P701_9PAST|nr:DUF2322 family protein [Muribacter muris]KMK51550.1 RNA polymerase subunit sigma-32 [[Actinobacillus] muris] [Muribacter muris]